MSTTILSHSLSTSSVFDLAVHLRFSLFGPIVSMKNVSSLSGNQMLRRSIVVIMFVFAPKVLTKIGRITILGTVWGTTFGNRPQ